MNNRKRGPHSFNIAIVRSSRSMRFYGSQTRHVQHKKFVGDAEIASHFLAARASVYWE